MDQNYVKPSKFHINLDYVTFNTYQYLTLTSVVFISTMLFFTL